MDLLELNFLWLQTLLNNIIVFFSISFLNFFFIGVTKSLSCSFKNLFI